ncbi:MAG: Ig-like domain-containing protein [Lachnospiraceae bacterium]|nr:Ig-like domain-containing protein [Lachnospiraceae bacterium]
MRRKALSLFMAAVMIATTPASASLASESGTAEAVIVSEENSGSAVIADDEGASSESVCTDEEPGVSEEETAEDETSGVSDEDVAEAAAEDEESGTSEEAAAETTAESDEEETADAGISIASIEVVEDPQISLTSEEETETGEESVVDSGLTNSSIAVTVSLAADNDGYTMSPLTDLADEGISVNESAEDLSYIWYRTEEFDGGGYSWYEIDDATESTYTIDPVTTFCRYICYIIDTNGGYMYVYYYIQIGSGLEASQNSFGYDADMYASLTLSAENYVTSEDEVTLSYQWYDNYETIDGATSSTYTISSVDAYGYYQCKVSDQYGNYVYLYYSVRVNSGLAVSTDTVTYTVNAGDSLTLTVDATVDYGSLTYSWYYYEKDEESGYYTSVLIEDSDSNILELTDIQNTTRYFCLVEDDYGHSVTPEFYVVVDTGLAYDGDNTIELYLSAGETAEMSLDSFSFSVNEDVELAYQWYKDGVKIDGATGTTCTTDAVTAYVQYTCSVSDPYGGELTFCYYIHVENNLSVSPADGEYEVTVSPGDNVILSVTVTADGTDDMTGYWYWYDEDGYYCEDTTSGTSLTLTSVTTPRYYYYQAFDAYGNGSSTYIYVRVDSGLDYADEDERWQSYYVSPGESLTLTVGDYTVNDGIDVTYQWYDGDEIEGATGSTYTIDSVEERTQYNCRVYDGYGNWIEFYYYVHVDNALYVEADEDTVTVEPGGSVTLSVTVTATNTDGLTYLWYWLDEDDNYYEADSAESSLTLTDVTESRYYWCSVCDTYGNSYGVGIYVEVDSGLTYSGSSRWTYLYPSPGEDVTLTAYATANDGVELSYQWYDDGETIDGATSSEYTLESVEESGYYICEVTDSYGGTLYLYYYVYIENNLLVSAAASTVTVDLGGSATLSVTATADNTDGLTYTWYYYDDGDYCEADSTSNTLELENIAATRYYYCSVEDAYGNSVTVSIRVKIDTGLAYNDPDNDDEGYYSYSVGYEGSLTLEAKATANEGIELTYEWYCDDGDELIDGAAASSYTIESVTESDWYYCKVSDGYGGYLWFEYYVYIEAGLTVSYTYSHYAVSGSDVTLDVEASVNSGSLTYQWYAYDEEKDGYVLLSDETGSSLTLTNVTEEKEYYCRVSDDYGNSDTAWFYVELVTSLSLSYDGYAPVVLGESVELTVEAVSPYSPITYQWYVYDYDEESYTELDDETGAALTVTPSAAGYSEYKCVVSDGTSTSDAYFYVYAYTLTLTYDDYLKLEPGESGTLTVTATSVLEDAEITYSWYQYVYDEGYVLIEDENASSLTVDASGDYRCIVSDSSSTQYAYFYVYVDTGLSASADSRAILAEAGSTVELSVSATTNYGTLSYLWYKWDDDGNKVTLGTSESLSLSNLTASSDYYYYYYYCTVSDGYNSTTLYLYVYVVDEIGETATSAADAVTMTLGDSGTAVIANSGDYMYYKITPTESGTYTFYTLSDYDTYGYLYDSNLNLLTSDDDSGTDCNFKITYDLTAGATYYLAVRYYSSYDVGVFTVYSVAGSEILDQCDHENVTHVAAVVATCTTAGNIEYWYCADCETYFSDEALTVEVSESDVVIAATGHIWDGGTVTTAANCTETGVKTYTCTICGETKTETIAATGHTAVTDAAVAATCTTSGLTEGSHCSVCGEVLVAQEVIAATGHTAATDAAVAATCTVSGLTEGSHCSVCGEVLVAQEVIAATGHTWDSGTVTEAATCATTGVKTYICTDCGTTKTETIAKLTTHTSTDTWVTTKEATCTTAGTQVQYCKYCGTSVTVKSETIAATGHTWSEWTTKSEATVFSAKILERTCSVCGETETTTSGEKLTATIKFNTTAGTIALKKGTTTTALKVTYANGDSIKSVKSSKTSIATVSVSKKGVITIKGKKVGTATITVTLASGKKKTIKVKVQKAAVKTTKITVTSKSVSIKKGKTYTLAPVLTPITSTQKITYTSSNKKVATVSSSGKITAKKEGTATITIKSGAKSVKVKVTVK